MATLTFNCPPPFTVNLLSEALPDSKEKGDGFFCARVQKVVRLPFQLISILFSSTYESAYTVLSHSWISFKYSVLNYDPYSNHFDVPVNLVLTISRITIWIFNMGLCFLEYTAANIQKKWTTPQQNHAELKLHLTALDPEHFQTSQKSIDVTGIPDTVQVNNLLEMFDENQPNQPGSINRNGATKENLQLFVKRINAREAFLGTPPKHDTPRLIAFYQQIEDAVRFSIHKVSQDLKDFQDQAGTHVNSYSKEQQKTYKDCRENIFRLAIDMALAGSRCGAAYMGEAMDAYYRASDGDHTGVELDLKDTLYELLARKRQSIATTQAQIHLGQNVHSYGKYMAALGPILAIPGSEKIIEHLSTLNNPTEYIALFLNEYTEDCIIELINKKIKTSQSFREKIITWVQDQADSWDQEGFNKQVLSITAQINAIPKKIKDPSTTDFYKTLENFKQLIDSCNNLPDFNKGWDNFIDELFSEKNVKIQLTKLFPDLINENIQKKLKASREKAVFQTILKKMSIDKSLIEKLKSQIEQKNFNIQKNQLVLDICSKKNWTSKVREILPIAPEILDPGYEDEVRLQDSIKGQIEQEKRSRFLDYFSFNDIDAEGGDLTKIEKEGISPELMEWLLVSHKIFQPQLDEAII